MKKLINICFILMPILVLAQVEVRDESGTAIIDANAVLDVNSTTKGLLLPRVDLDVNIPTTSTAGMIIYVEESQRFLGWDGTQWLNLGYDNNTNTAPQVNTVIINGIPEIGETLIGNYNYSDAQSDPDDASTFIWKLADDTSGINLTSISGATTENYVVVATDETKYFQFCVTPGSSTGLSPGTEACSVWFGPIVQPSPFLLQETFETDGNTRSGGTRYTTSVDEYLEGGDDFFTRIDEANNLPSGLSSSQNINAQEGNFYFGAVDLDSEGGSDEQSITFASSIDISGLSSIDLAILIGEDDDNTNEDWDGGDRFDVQFNIDSSGWSNVLSVRASSFSSNNHEPAIDTSNGVNGLGDGVRITDTFQEFTKNIPVNGSTLQVRLFFKFQVDHEDIALDNLRLTGNL